MEVENKKCILELVSSSLTKDMFRFRGWRLAIHSDCARENNKAAVMAIN